MLRFSSVVSALSCAAVLLALPLRAAADTYTYSYTGEDFDAFYGSTFFPTATNAYTTSDFLTISFTLAAPLAANLDESTDLLSPLSFTFSDGVETLTDATPDNLPTFQVGTDVSGDIDSWVIGEHGNVSQSGGLPELSILSMNLGPGLQSDGASTMVPCPPPTVGYCFKYGASADLSADPSWTVTDNVTTPPPTAAPEPAPFLMVATGLLCAGVTLRRRSLVRFNT